MRWGEIDRHESEGCKVVNQSEIDDLKLVESAGLQPLVAHAAQTMVISLHMLRKLSAETGLPMEKIAAQLIVDRLKSAERPA